MIIANDDVLTSSYAINLIFSVAISHRLDFFHPSLSLCSYWTHRSLLHREGSIVRQVKHIEPIFPGFSSNALSCLQKLPLLSISGYGLDVHLWPRIALSHKMRTAVVDQVIVRHMRPVSSGNRSYSNNLTAREETLAVFKYCEANHSFIESL